SSSCTNWQVAHARPTRRASTIITTITDTRNTTVEEAMDIVLLNLRISMWGVSRAVSDRQYEVDADKAMVRATKKILECPEYEFLLQLKRRIHRRLRSLALPGEI